MAAKFDITDVLPLFYCGTRCRTCAQIRSNDRTLPEGFCEAHDTQATSYEARLGRWCCDLRDEFMLPRLIHWTGPLPFLGGSATAYEDLLWRRAVMMTQDCENSLLELEGRLKTFLTSTDWITNIEEFKYHTGVPFNYTHCAFNIITLDNQAFVFDPTGIQFGPDWAVLTAWEDYVSKRGDAGALPGLVVRPLGRNAEWTFCHHRQGDY